MYITEGTDEINGCTKRINILKIDYHCYARSEKSYFYLIFLLFCQKKGKNIIYLLIYRDFIMIILYNIIKITRGVIVIRRGWGEIGSP